MPARNVRIEEREELGQKSGERQGVCVFGRRARGELPVRRGEVYDDGEVRAFGVVVH